MAEALETEFFAVTRQVREWPWSAGCTTYVFPEPLITLPSRSHEYANVRSGTPVQVPVEHDSVCPTVGVPDRTGAAVFTGALRTKATATPVTRPCVTAMPLMDRVMY
jgi:hypothetical protein